jgi:hypothetical protein
MAEYDEAVRRVPGDMRKETKAEVRVIRLPIERMCEAAELFARSFHTNPDFMYLFPDERARSLACSQPSANMLVLGISLMRGGRTSPGTKDG